MAEESVYRRIRKNMDEKNSLDDISLKTGIPKDTLGDIERGYRKPAPEDVVVLSDAYDNKRLCRWYCASECPVGQRLGLPKVDGLEKEQLGLIALSLIDSINSLQKVNIERVVEISKDGLIDVTETDDYTTLKKSLRKISKAYNALLRWEEDGNIIGCEVPKDKDEE
ncbi:MAG: helix-turn-helix transcriptional regulator [Lachnospiraceae bacterium]|nr:helix-turn-helix transcriptional regulator [Lachnospiraceae bacterium]